MEGSSDIDDDYSAQSRLLHQKNQVSDIAEAKNTKESPPPLEIITPKEQRPIAIEPSMSKILVEPLHVASSHKDKEDSDSPISAIPSGVSEQVCPDPVGRTGSTPNQESGPSDNDHEREKVVLKEVEKEIDETSESSNSTESTESLDYSEDSARGDSILPTLEDSLYLHSKKHPRFVLMDPLEGPTEGKPSQAFQIHPEIIWFT